MDIVSLNFAGFVSLTFILYYLVPRRVQNYLLLLASYIFYFFWAWQFALLLAVVTGFNFIFARQLQPHRKPKKSLLWIGIGLNLLTLAFFKYANFFVPEMVALLTRLGLRVESVTLQILLPIGLSFYILQAISYLVEVYRNQIPDGDNPVDFALYLAYFPKLTAGPIERARTFLPKLAQHRIVDNTVLANSFTLIVIGLVRKVVVADILLGAIPAQVFETPLEFSAYQLAAWLLAYAFGLYSDFAGYTNIVRGVSGLFGLELSRNFAHPFFARNYTEFWNRWHISLSHWLRDYIYFPLNRALIRRNPGRYYWGSLVIPPLATMLASGLWHGTGWNFLAWGTLMGLFQIIERVASLWRPVTPPDQQPGWRQGLGMLAVFVPALLAGVLFRMEIPTALTFWQGLFTWGNWTPPDSRVFWVIVPALWLDWVQYRNRNELTFLTWPRIIQSILLALAILAIFLAGRTELGEPFIYQGF